MTQVTVVIPTRDRMAFLPAAVESALADRRVGADVVVVDDGSTDGTRAWLGAHPDPRVRWIPNDGRERCAARNAGLAVTSTPYVLFLDDDVLTPGALSALLRAVERSPRAVVGAGTYATFGTYAPGDVPRRQPTTPVAMTRDMWREVLWGWYLLPGAGLWRADALRRVGGWDEASTPAQHRREHGIVAEDLELNLRIHPEPMALVPRVTLRWRQHGRRLTDAERDGILAANAWHRERFLERVSPSERATGERIIAAKAMFEGALEHHTAGDYRRSTAGFRDAFRTAPEMLRSPVLGPWLAGVVLRSAAARAVPARAAAAMRGRRRRSRERRFTDAAR
jgi:glycosyltransferase involved in cell wall biosynthesis